LKKSVFRKTAKISGIENLYPRRECRLQGFLAQGFQSTFLRVSFSTATPVFVSQRIPVISFRPAKNIFHGELARCSYLMQNLAEEFGQFRPGPSREELSPNKIRNLDHPSSPRKNNQLKFRSHVDSATPRSTYQQRASRKRATAIQVHSQSEFTG
jgi:hypothetical protein